MIFLRGFLIGFAIAAPVGPIGVLCIRRTLANGRLIGFVSGLGAATADMFYGAVAAFGLTAIQDILVGQQFWLHLLGGLFLIYLGARTFLTKPVDKRVTTDVKRGSLSAYLSALGLTLTNPATIISFTVVFAGILPSSVVRGSSSLALILGVFSGSATWWLTLSGIVGWFRERFTPAWMTWVNRIAGIVILGFGLTALFIKS